MSQLEVAKNSQTTFCFQYAAMGSVGAGGVAGVATPAAPVANFFPACSKVVGAERVISLGTPGTAVYVNTPNVVPNANPALAGAFPTIRSNDIADQSTYAIFWTNQVAYSPNQSILPC